MNPELKLPILESSPGSAGDVPDDNRSWWRTLSELAQSPEVRAYLQQEFQEGAGEASPGTRRDFLRLMAASMTLAGAAGCNIRPPQETIVPAARRTDAAAPGRAQYYTTAMDFAGAALGLTVESRDGRPTKIEGNPNQPTSRGATSVFAQAMTLDLYDPDRLSMPTNKRNAASLEQFSDELEAIRRQLDETAGQGLRILTGMSTSPTLGRLLGQLTTRWPKSRWSVFEPFNHDSQRRGLKRALGSVADDNTLVYDLSQPSTVLSIDCDFLAARDLPVCYIQQFAASRQLVGRKGLSGSAEAAASSISRLYHLGSTPTLTASKADHSLAVRPGRLATVLNALAEQLASRPSAAMAELDARQRQWVQKLAADLNQRDRPAVILVGHDQPADVHEFALVLNGILGSLGRTVHVAQSPEVRPESSGSDSQMVESLIEEMREGEVQWLFVLGGNPGFGTQPGTEFAQSFEHVPFSMMLSSSANETSRLVNWVIPRSHFLESWGDARGHDGTATVIQPLIAPLYPSLSDIELLASLLGESSMDGYHLVRSTWSDLLEIENNERGWRQALADGVIPNTSFDRREHVEATASADQLPLTSAEASTDEWEVVVRPDPTVWDGQFGNNGWLQELPKPLSHVVWENVAWIAPDDAEKLGVVNGDIIEVRGEEGRWEIPVWIVPGQVIGCVTLFAGYGRRSAGRAAANRGVEVWPVAAPKGFGLASVVPTGRRTEIASTQHHQMMEGRHLARAGTLAEFLSSPLHPEFAHPPTPAPETSMYRDWPREGHQWGMTIDLTACVGCSACVIACQAENNIPVVGKKQVALNRQMHWIRVDTYYKGPPDSPSQTLHQPVPCMHCETAPCEVVCPVAATTHSSEGINQMVYNRCIGTRYCSNNCPYKVRRFNFLNYSDEFLEDPTLDLLSNPEVTVRSRGVMEKCTYCIQRIERVRIDASLEDRSIADGEIRTACQAACPAQAIRFGDLNDPESMVRNAAEHPLNYGLLEELNTRPRTTYLAEVRNPQESGESPEA